MVVAQGLLILYGASHEALRSERKKAAAQPGPTDSIDDSDGGNWAKKPSLVIVGPNGMSSMCGRDLEPSHSGSDIYISDRSV